MADMTNRASGAACLAALLAMAPMGAGRAATLHVGPGQTIHLPSEAASMAHDGDTITIDPGDYFDCAIWRADNLVIAGAGPGVVLTDRACEGKAALIARGNGITVRDLTLARIRVADGNGAGIRVEGSNLTIAGVRFLNNQLGILAGDADRSTLIVRDCEFADNGTSANASADILAGRIAGLRIEGSQFRDGKAGPSITSSAAGTTLVGNRFRIGGTAPYDAPYVIGVLNDGGLAMQDNEIVLMAGAPRLGVVLTDAEGIWPGGSEVVLRGTVLANHAGAAAILLRNWNGSAPVLTGTVLQPGDIALSSDGVVLHRAKQAGHAALDRLRRIAGKVHQAAALSLRHLF